jgi:hypothetical protein
MFCFVISFYEFGYENSAFISQKLNLVLFFKNITSIKKYNFDDKKIYLKSKNRGSLFWKILL